MAIGGKLLYQSSDRLLMRGVEKGKEKTYYKGPDIFVQKVLNGPLRLRNIQGRYNFASKINPFLYALAKTGPDKILCPEAIRIILMPGSSSTLIDVIDRAITGA